MTHLDNDRQHAPAWAFVLEHARKIDRVTRAMCAGTSISRDDLHGSLCADLVERFAGFDPSRGEPGAWIWMRCQAVRRGLIRQSVRNTGAPLDLGTGEAPESRDPLPVGARGHAGRVEAMAALAPLIRRASPEQVRACQSILLGWGATEIRAAFGSTRHRNELLARLAEPGARHV
jgi:hypothetical protein